jgi:hypothetical protein
MITIENALPLFKDCLNPIQRSRVFGCNTVNRYVLLNDIKVCLSNNEIITIPNGYVWDLSSVPRLFWSICAPDGDFELASLIHDYLYENKMGKAFADKEMLKWSLLLYGTKGISIKNIDCYVRYYAVKYFGGKKYKD